jgi:GNAT superfamily N-acetyltransferase
MKREPYSARELGVATLHDFETLAVKQGGCWCIFYQRANPLRRGTTSEEWKRRNRSDKRALVRSGRSHAILVYEGLTPVGWCQYGAREELPRIDARRTYRKVAPPVRVSKLWRITCFFVDPKYRGRGVAKFALHAALDSIGKRGGGVVEAYPVASAKMAAVPEWRWFGTPGMFRKEGFRTVARLGTSGVLMRKTIASRRAKKP